MNWFGPVGRFPEQFKNRKTKHTEIGPSFRACRNVMVTSCMADCLNCIDRKYFLVRHD